MKTALMLLLAALLALDAGASRVSPRPAAPEAQPRAPTIYPLALELRDQGGERVGLDVFRGHPVIISMFYGSCPVACPLILAHVRQLEGALPEDARDDTRVLLVSFDPEHDTPAALAVQAARQRLDLRRFKLATGSPDDVRALANALGISYQALPEGGFAHTSVITVLDREGATVARSDDMTGDITSLRGAVLQASN